MELRMNDISVSYPGVQALDQVSLSVSGGTTHALIGANGAGKSTLMKVLSGSEPSYTGSISINGQNVSIQSPKDAQKHGIQMVQQEVDAGLVPNLTVAENLHLHTFGANNNVAPFIKWKQIRKQASDSLQALEIKIAPNTLVSDLSLAEKQMILITRAVLTDCKILILDEPTAPLSLSETKQLFRIVRDLLKKNVAVIFISHRLPELFEICDLITVMRNGCMVSSQPISRTSIEQVVEDMLGEPLQNQFVDRIPNVKEIFLEARELSDGLDIENVSLHVKKGEIIGLAGLVGAGKTELCKLLFGASKATSGSLLLDGEHITLTSPSEAVKHGLALVPEERRKEGILVGESVLINLATVNLKKFSNHFGFINVKKQKKAATEMVDVLDIKTPRMETLVAHLSGGNQQKVAIGKWLVADADVYIFDEPTKGVDVGARKDIFELISVLAKRGKSVIYASCELADIIGMTDRTYVLYDGQIVKELITKDTNEEELLYLSTGGN
ncbi:sugar ABC transporter ATP-binding protein [Alkalicoccobacillus porphyridii]|uniref:Sugar ABC transporter ATP-binding protein n=1 Tax=Alkalicoccobacillus porphyridii TaxID=2597270 RepID=A0A553ZXV2_9BACI|nr:sugar ABC transporter ATP-binding protein [Alkalicoccobacillus porphyridii]TSB46186.1 sugar ABC transporter ATP-binding protein [Alkalicoccobacillus porphyridii]